MKRQSPAQVETLPFVNFIPENARKLILGSFPCRKRTAESGKPDYGDWFYSGSGKNHFWQLLADVYKMPAATRFEKEALCRTHGIALSDVALRIRRLRSNCSDSNLRIVEYNFRGVQSCLDAGVNRIFFTSRFVQSHFFKMFPACTLPTFVLPSPSPAANKHIGSLAEYKNMVKAGQAESTYAYRLWKYRALLQ